ncbi:acyl-CoA thioesterase [Roseinatronobacter bogoriensis]|uniref:Acyl-CoA thioesterase n=1 Tax=Roseinatronobacter bogoriensis subsp. barguzinensis TaxID=441209 RepID=A0A2K8KD38_9RHOB|nr:MULTISPECIES: acyl-CoA thioesterase [Rhodobaca]ATX67371.1 acyl-CoA thioesterase [Rhodobaca barguzinensis]TDW41685.1 thioesterase superfamily protein [Rhodobaca barguzinensis]TDY74136.1 thioesterase superfamily protein [Rhodobaca bogoriensis DSM 18756]
MYPFVRFTKEMLKYRNAPRLGVCDLHVSYHRCWPWDLDPWVELNNGRTLTLYDLGRIPMAMRTGLIDVLRKNGWGITVAGNSTRYRRRVRAFERFELRSRCIGWDTRFLYTEQGMWKGEECANHILIRSAITSAQGIVPPAQVLRAMGQPEDSPELPQWAQLWITAEAARPWPPVI